MMVKKAVIVGGGIAGLSVGSYLQMCGYDTHIYEMHTVPGGLCTAWKRGDYTIDLCLHWLVGSGPADSFYDRWNELLDMSQMEIVNHEVWMTIQDEEGEQFRVFTNAERLREEMLRISPEDKREIDELVQSILKLAQLNMPTEHNMATAGLWYRLRALWHMLPNMGIMGKNLRISVRDYATRFSHPLLRKGISHLFDPDSAMLFVLLTQAWMHKQAAGYPVGGSLRFALKIAHRYQARGGQLHLGKRVARIRVENNRATGIMLADGQEIAADLVISAADLHTTLQQLLGGHHSHPRLDEYFAQHPTFPSLIYLSYGIGRSLRHLPHSWVLPLAEPLQVDSKTRLNDLFVRIHHYDPTLAPEGKNLVTVMIETRSYSYWEQLATQAPIQYAQEKQRLSQQVLAALEQHMGTLSEYVEMTDVATPATLVRYTGNWRGSYEGWLMTPGRSFSYLPQQLKGLDGLYLAGHWVAVGGGVPSAMKSARDVAEQICHRDGVPFLSKQAVGN